MAVFLSLLFCSYNVHTYACTHTYIKATRSRIIVSPTWQLCLLIVIFMVPALFIMIIISCPQAIPSNNITIIVTLFVCVHWPMIARPYYKRLMNLWQVIYSPLTVGVSGGSNLTLVVLTGLPPFPC